MRHNVSSDGFLFSLRPVAMSDAEFILSLRSDPQLNRFINATSPVLKDQQDWIERYFSREGDWYFIITRKDGSSVGTIGIYDHEPDEGTAEWGRWIVRPDSQAAVESAWLIYRAAFEVIGLRAVYSRTLIENERVVSFHDSSGARRERIIPNYVDIGGHHFDAVEHSVDRDVWPGMGRRLETLAARFARLESGAVR